MNRGLYRTSHRYDANSIGSYRGVLHAKGRSAESLSRRPIVPHIRLPDAGWEAPRGTSRTDESHRQASSGERQPESRSFNSDFYGKTFGEKVRQCFEKLASGRATTPGRGRTGEQSSMTLLSRIQGFLAVAPRESPKFDASMAQLVDDFRNERASNMATLIESTSIKGAQLSLCQVKLEDCQNELNKWQQYAKKLEKECLKCGANIPKAPDEE